MNALDARTQSEQNASRLLREEWPTREIPEDIDFGLVVERIAGELEEAKHQSIHRGKTDAQRWWPLGDRSTAVWHGIVQELTPRFAARGYDVHGDVSREHGLRRFIILLSW